MMDFGQILEPSSRAFWDDFDYEQEENLEIFDKHQSKINWEWRTEDKKEPSHLDINEFFVIEGSGIQDFFESTIGKNQNPIGGLTNNNILLYHFVEDNNLILISFENDLNLSAIIANYFKNFLEKAKNVVTFSFQSKTQYKGENVKDIGNSLIILKGINSKLEYIEELKSPNFITGVAAGVATIRFLKKLSFSSYIAYTDPFNEIDTFAAEPVLKFFRDINIRSAERYVSKLKDTSLLYM